MFISNFSFLHNYFCFCWITYADVTITFLKFAYCFPKDNNNDDDDDDDDDNNNNNILPETRKYWVDVQGGIVSSREDRDPL